MTEGRVVRSSLLKLLVAFCLFLVARGADAAKEGVTIWLVHSSHTGGHRAAAKALARALEEIPGVRSEVVNTMDYLPASVRYLQEEGFAAVASCFSGMKKKSFEASVEGKESTVNAARRGLAVKAFFSRSFLKRLRDEAPDLVLSTHSQTNVMLSIWKRHGKIDMPVHCVVTDYATHAMWACEELDRYYVASEAVGRALRGYGVQGDRIRVTGIPVDPNFARVPKADPVAARRLIGLDEALPTITMMGGSLGFGPYEEVVEALEAAGRPVQLLAMTGKNEARRERLEAMAGSLKSVRLHCYGFVDRFYRFMDAADAVITKPGGLTVTELLLRGKPMIMLRPAGGLEGHAAQGVAELGVAELVEDGRGLANFALEVTGNEGLMDERRAAVEAHARPRAVFDVASQIVDAARQ